MIFALGYFLSVLLGTQGFNTQHSIEPQADFDLEKFTGEWYRLGVADESNTFAMLKHHLKVSKGLLVADASGNVNLTMWTMRPYGCSISVYSYEKTDVPGAFTYFSKRHKIIKDITMVETNYTDYSLVLKYKSMDKEYTQIALYARSATPTLEVIQKFRSFALTVGFSEEAIMVPADIDHCPNLETSQLWTFGYIYSVLLHIWATMFVLTKTVIEEMQLYNISKPFINH
ncbi:lipocalin-15 isoform X1 [Triplophysa dalaica]|uniref:lipocalin-15 isoform X1 n=1 Tax=Triplophysa dalaica TaxID=1582913 RepID=UPI0024E01F2F|nr:lipocalin-15 isoform X1 [Triplophysa dalaica]